MLSRCVLSFTMIAGVAFGASAMPTDALVKGQTTVAEVEQTLGAPADTVMRPDGALTLTYAYARCARQMPASFPVRAANAMDSSKVSLRFGADFRYRSAAVTTMTAAAAGDTAAKTLAAK